MEIKALSTFTAFDEGQMKVFNAGDVGEVSDNLAQGYIDAGLAEETTQKAASKSKAKSGGNTAVDADADDGAAEPPAV